MLDRTLDCVVSETVSEAADARPLHAVRPDGLAALRAALPAAQAAFLADCGFEGKRGQLALLAGEHGIAAAVAGLGDERGPMAFGGLARALPAGRSWRLAAGDYQRDDAVLGFCLGAYRFDAFRPAAQGCARIVVGATDHGACAEASVLWMVRDLINAPANLLGPGELAGHAVAIARRHGAEAELVADNDLAQRYPAVAVVGGGSARPPAVAAFRWAGSLAAADAPLLAVCGKGICFDSGGYDLKPSAGMLRMKKDMAGAAVALGLARRIMQADLPIRLSVRLACAENSVSGSAMRPLDVIRTRYGLSVEVGNTDAEGRLVLCDLLAEAAAERPALLLDFATLTGAARVALGPDLPALFCNDDGWADGLLQAGRTTHDPLWRLPLWPGYRDWLNSPVADLNTVSSKPMAGAIVAALFLERFVPAGTAWAHIDLYGWNDQDRPGRPEGGEAQAIRATFAAVRQRLGVSHAERDGKLGGINLR